MNNITIIIWILVVFVLVQIAVYFLGYYLRRRQTKLRNEEFNTTLRESEERIRKIMERMQQNRDTLLESMLAVEDILKTAYRTPDQPLNPPTSADNQQS